MIFRKLKLTDFLMRCSSRSSTRSSLSSTSDSSSVAGKYFQKSESNNLKKNWQGKTPDEVLRELMSPQRYIKLNHILITQLPDQYRREMAPFCPDLIENARKIGHLYPKPKPNQQLNQEELSRDPETMTNEELFAASKQLEEMIKQQRKKNLQTKMEIQLLDPGKRRMDLESHCLFIQLYEEEMGRSSFN